MGIIGVPEGEEEDQNIENLFEQIMKENFPNLAKEILSGIPESSKNPKEVGPKEAHTKAHQIKLPKKRILKAAREKETVTFKGVPIRLSFL